MVDWLGRKAETLEGIKKGDTVIIVAPGVRAEWASCEQRFKDNKVGNECWTADILSDAGILCSGILAHSIPKKVGSPIR